MPLHWWYMLSLYRKRYRTEVLLKGKTGDCESRDMGQHSGNQLLLATKFTIPPVRSDLVARPRLVHTLEACMEHPLTLLAAPAGFGKTVLLSAWAHQQQSVGWVSLDSSDNDPAQFWTYVLAALDRLHPGLGSEPLSLLQSEQSAPIETVLEERRNNHEQNTFYYRSSRLHWT